MRMMPTILFAVLTAQTLPDFDLQVPGESRSVLAHFFARLGTSDKRWITLKGGDHASLLETTTPTFIDAVAGFIAGQRGP